MKGWIGIFTFAIFSYSGKRFGSQACSRADELLLTTCLADMHSYKTFRVCCDLIKVIFPATPFPRRELLWEVHWLASHWPSHHRLWSREGRGDPPRWVWICPSRLTTHDAADAPIRSGCAALHRKGKGQVDL